MIVISALLGRERGEADAYANLLWCAQVVPLLLMGYVLLAKVGLSFSRLRHVREEIDAETGRTQVAP